MIRAFLQKVRQFAKNKFFASPAHATGNKPRIIPRSEHTISRANISENALKVLHRLNRQGYEAYLVGGGVRDLLLGLHPKDFDVVTNAKPEEVRRVFRNCRLIGRRFRLAHVYFGYDIIEVATYRGKAEVSSEEISHSDHGMILRDNVYGSMEQDWRRRDFTINALYYNIADFSVVDYCGGYADLKAKRMRMIGDVKERYREDPVRMLRAIRFASKVKFDLPAELSQPMGEMKDLMSHVSSARLFEEMMKLFHSGAALPAYELLTQHHLFGELFPATQDILADKSYPTHTLLSLAFKNTDARIQQQKTVTPAFIIAALLWYPVCARAKEYIENGMVMFPARVKAIEEILHQQAKRLSIPKRIVQGVREIWLLQMRLSKRFGKRAQELMEEPRFRAAYDFLELRAQAGEPVQDLVQWWHEFIEGDATVRRTLIKALMAGARKKKNYRQRQQPPSAVE